MGLLPLSVATQNNALKTTGMEGPEPETGQRQLQLRRLHMPWRLRGARRGGGDFGQLYVPPPQVLIPGARKVHSEGHHPTHRSASNLGRVLCSVIFKLNPTLWKFMKTECEFSWAFLANTWPYVRLLPDTYVQQKSQVVLKFNETQSRERDQE